MTWVLGMCCFTPVFCQISQNHPELCGDSTKTVPLPPGMSATINHSNGAATLRYGPNRAIDLGYAIDEVRQVCRVESDKLVAFTWDSIGYDVKIIEQSTGILVDSFAAYDPVMSPNQRWIASRNFYPPQSEIRISEEYLLYDLDASPSDNRHNPTPYTSGVLGWAMYPRFPGAAPMNLLDIPDSNLHLWRSKSFFWAPDSQSVVFADSVGPNLSLVLVVIKNDKPQAYTHSLSIDDPCSSTLEDASINPVPGRVPNVVARFSGCEAQPLNLTSNDFQPAKIEVYEPRPRKKSTPKKAPKP